MLKRLTATTAIALIAAPLAFAGTQTVDVRGFDRIDTRGAMKVVYQTGPDTSVVIETDRDDFSDAKVFVDGQTLVVTRESVEKRGLLGSSANIRISDEGQTVRVNGKKVPTYTVRVTSPDLKGIKASQSSRGTLSGINATSFEASATSSADLILSGRAGKADISASSSGEVTATSFEAGELVASASSSGEVDALAGGTGAVKVSASSSGDISIRSLQAANFSVNSSSGGDIELTGACKDITINASSGGDVEADELTCQSARVDASSGSDVEAFASVSANGNASSGANVKFRGNPADRQVNQSSGGKIRFD